MRKIIWFSLIGVVIAVDQLSKWAITKSFHFGETRNIFPSFDLTLRYNTGAAFNFLAEADGWQRWFFIGLALTVFVIVSVWLIKLPLNEKLEGFALSLIAGGAVGNLIDRLVHGHVIDFILVYYKAWEWPAFNIADSAICVGVALLLIKIIKKPS